MPAIKINPDDRPAHDGPVIGVFAPCDPRIDELAHIRAGNIVRLIADVVAAYGAAASLGDVTATNVGTGSAEIASCDTNGVDVDYTLDGGLVSIVVITRLSFIWMVSKWVRPRQF
ncbi:MAG: hypothetical protein IIB42_08695 [Candidatus Marinimicrobia bacterium]|nr:hypothetical protein [Candidatus Neomarinimicrobiota bacterium]